MSIACDPSTLIEAAKCTKCIPAGMRDAVKTYLLAVANGGSTDPSTLMQSAREFQKIPDGIQDMVQLYLMCDWPGVGICSHPIVTDWLQRLANDYQPMPSTQTIQAVCDFCDRLTMYGLTDKLLVVNPVIPDSLLAMRYPLIYQPGNGFSPFINVGFVEAQLSENGILGDGASDYFDTGFNPSVHWLLDTSSAGVSIYESAAATQFVNPEYEIGVENLALPVVFKLSTWEPAIIGAVSLCYNAPSTLGAGIADTPSFYSSERISNTDYRMYNASSGIPFAQIDFSNANQAGVTIPNGTMLFMADRATATGPHEYSTKRISFMSIHEGLTAAEAEDLFWCVQFLRIDLGGGYA